MKHNPPTVFEKDQQARRIAASQKDLEDNLPLMRVTSRISARRLRDAYEELVAAGFDAVQALAILCAQEGRK